MPEVDARAGGWSELAVYPTLSAAEVDAAYLRSEGVPARVWGVAALPTHTCGLRLMVDTDQLERARWLMKIEPVTEAELDFLATGKLPGAEG